MKKEIKENLSNLELREITEPAKEVEIITFMDQLSKKQFVDLVDLIKNNNENFYKNEQEELVVSYDKNLEEIAKFIKKTTKNIKKTKTTKKIEEKKFAFVGLKNGVDIGTFDKLKELAESLNGGKFAYSEKEFKNDKGELVKSKQAGFKFEVQEGKKTFDIAYPLKKQGEISIQEGKMQEARIFIGKDKQNNKMLKLYLVDRDKDQHLDILKNFNAKSEEEKTGLKFLHNKETDYQKKYIIVNVSFNKKNQETLKKLADKYNKKDKQIDQNLVNNKAKGVEL